MPIVLRTFRCANTFTGHLWRQTLPVTCCLQANDANKRVTVGIGLAISSAACFLSSKSGMCDDDLTLLPDEKLNQPPGRPQSLAAWSIVREGKHHYIERDDNRNERYKSPDGSNFVEGVSHPPFIRQSNWSLLQTKMPDHNRPGDIWVSTFPKCGTTFMEQICLLLLNNGDATNLTPQNQNQYNPDSKQGKVWVEASVRLLPDDPTHPGMIGLTLDEFDALPAPRLLKTHAPIELFLGVTPTTPASLSNPGRPTPLAEGIKVIYVSRNCKDACVSAYYHAANPHKLGFPFDAWVVNFMSGLFEHGRWSDHVLGWRSAALSNPQQILWVRYEDLKANPEKEIRRVESFLGLGVSDDVIAKTVVNSGFKQMQKQAGTDFFRKGVVGDHRRHFSAALNHEFDEIYAEQMRGATDPYADLLQSQL